MNYALKASALALTLSLAATASPAWADFWSDAGAKFKGVTLHGVTESTPPSNYIRNVLAPEFEKKTGIKVDIETTSWDQMYDKAIKDMKSRGMTVVIMTHRMGILPVTNKIAIMGTPWRKAPRLPYLAAVERDDDDESAFACLVCRGNACRLLLGRYAGAGTHPRQHYLWRPAANEAQQVAGRQRRLQPILQRDGPACGGNLYPSAGPQPEAGAARDRSGFPRLRCCSRARSLDRDSNREHSRNI